jgi:hypothetical protein
MVVARYPLPVVPSGRRLEVVRRLVAEATAAHAARDGDWRESLLVRNAAMVTLAITTGARSGEVSAIDLADWHRRRRAVTLRRGPAFQEEQPLDDTTTALLRMWLPHRARVLAALDGGEVPALFVSLRPDSCGGVVVAVAGTPRQSACSRSTTACTAVPGRPPPCSCSAAQRRSNRSRFITLLHAATKSRTNFSSESSQA